MECTVLSARGGRWGTGGNGALEHAFAINIHSAEIIAARSYIDGGANRCETTSWVNRERANGNRRNPRARRVLGLSESKPGCSAVGGDPQAAIGPPEINVARVIGIDGQRGYAPRCEWRKEWRAGGLRTNRKPS